MTCPSRAAVRKIIGTFLSCLVKKELRRSTATRTFTDHLAGEKMAKNIYQSKPLAQRSTSKRRLSIRISVHLTLYAPTSNGIPQSPQSALHLSLLESKAMAMAILRIVKILNTRLYSSARPRLANMERMERIGVSQSSVRPSTVCRQTR